MRRLLDCYSAELDMTAQETLLMPAIVLPSKPHSYARQIGRHYAQLDGLSEDNYIDKLIFRDQAERVAVAKMH